jgi:hypothetical protein
MYLFIANVFAIAVIFKQSAHSLLCAAVYLLCLHDDSCNNVLSGLVKIR